MSIFDEDEALDHYEGSLLKRGKDELSTKTHLTKTLGINFTTDLNLSRKSHHFSSFRMEMMDPFASQVKSLKPMNLLFNSILKKSGLSYYSEADIVKLKYKEMSMKNQEE